MPKVGQEPIRREALVNAAIAEIGRAGSLDVTVAQIARAAGMSPALAHHYFGGKTEMQGAAMRQILRLYGAEVRAALAQDPTDRLAAILRASFSATHFRREVIAAWLTFYVQAHTSPVAARLLRIYHARLRSNLVHALRPAPDAAERAQTVAALIDGLYLRAALGGAMRGEEAVARVLGVARPGGEAGR